MCGPTSEGCWHEALSNVFEVPAREKHLEVVKVLSKDMQDYQHRHLNLREYVVEYVLEGVWTVGNA